MAKICCVMLLLLAGCGKEVVVDVPEEKPVDVEAFISSVDTQARALATTLAAQKLTGEMTLKNTQAIMAKLNTLEASFAKSSTGKDGDPKSVSPPESPAKADTQTPVKAATPGTSSHVASDGTVLRWNVEGNWNPTILETSQHLGQDHGIDTNGMTHQQMADLHASIHDGTATNGGQPVSGGIFQNNQTSSVTSQRSSIRSVPQRVSFFGRAKYSTRQSCPSGRCPQR
jgi:hypothetical protein